MNLNQENIEEFILLHIDGELTKEEEESLAGYLEKYPQAKQLLEEYKATILPPETIIFEGKEQLLKPNRRVFAFSLSKKTLGIAASMAILLSFSFGWWFGTRQTVSSKSVGGQVATTTNTTTSQNISGNISGNAATTKTTANDPIHASSPTGLMSNQRQKPNMGNKSVIVPAQSGGLVQLNSPANHGPFHLASIPEIRTIPQQQLQEKSLAINLKKGDLTTFPASLNNYSNTEDVASQSEATNVVDELLGADDDEDILGGWGSIVSQFKERGQGVSETIKDLKRTSFVIKLGEKEITLKK